MAVAKEGASSFEDTSLSALFDEYFYSVNQNLNQNNNIKNTLSEYFEYSTLHLGGTSVNSIPEYKKLSGGKCYLGDGAKYMMVLSDGTIIYFYFNRYFHIDVNGFKGPNILGRDLFLVKINQKGKIKDGTNLGGGTYYTNIVSAGWKMNY